jgi:hypothetical protein
VPLFASCADKSRLIIGYRVSNLRSMKSCLAKWYYNDLVAEGRGAHKMAISGLQHMPDFKRPDIFWPQADLTCRKALVEVKGADAGPNSAAGWEARMGGTRGAG